ncbi:MAG: DUF962 domain-containing protein [Acinetobacter sp.]|nr:DUF962 domain-containing protein [Acinetobacter sp.]
MSYLTSQKSLAQWLTEYGQSHQNHRNKRIHYVCVPAIFMSIVAMLFLWQPYVLIVIAIGVLWFYLRLSWALCVAMLLWIVLCCAIAYSLALSVWGWIAVFVIAWIGQFIGHKIEGAKPSFLQDLQFLLIGPAWVACAMMNKLPTTQH